MKFNWAENYYLARVLLNFSEEEFWKSNPRRIATLLAVKGFYEGRLQQKQTAQTKASELMRFL